MLQHENKKICIRSKGIKKPARRAPTEGITIPKSLKLSHLKRIPLNCLRKKLELRSNAQPFLLSPGAVLRSKSKLDLSLMFQESTDSGRGDSGKQNPEVLDDRTCHEAKVASQASSHGESCDSTNIDNRSQAFGLPNLVHLNNMFLKKNETDGGGMLQAPKYDKDVDDMVFSDTESQHEEGVCDF